MYVTSLYTPNLIGGAERVVQSLAESMVEAGHHALVVSAAPQEGTRVDWINGVKVYYIGLKNLYWPYRDGNKPRLLKPFWHGLDTFNPLMANQLARILNTEQPNLVHTHTLGGFSVLAWRQVKQRGLPLVHTLHDYYLLCPKSTMFRNGRNCRRQCAQCLPYALPRKWYSSKVDVITGITRFILDRHLEYNYFATVRERKVIFNAYQAQSAATNSGTRSLPIRFGYLGRLHPTKGLEVLLDAVARLPEGTWDLDIGGKGLSAYENYLHSRYSNPRIKYMGYVSPENLCSNIDVLVIPSIWHEPFGRVISEAYAHGVPVIGSKRGGIPELVEEPHTGFLFDPSRPGDLTLKMWQFIENPAIIDDMRLASLTKAGAFLPEDIVEQYLEVYGGL
jgi:glycosyltransferase involved in cell wall biosynthesis